MLKHFAVFAVYFHVQMFDKRKSLINLGLAFLLTLAIIVFPPPIIFDYDFESFFPQEDEELAFYQSFREEFGNDNDYLLIALGNNGKTVFERDFLEKANGLQSDLEKLEGVEKIASLLELESPIISPFGVRYRRLLDWSDEEILRRSKENILESQKFKANLISEDGAFILLILQHQQRISKEDGDRLFAQIETLLSALGLPVVYTAGKIKAQGEFVQLMQNEFSFFLGISIILIVLLLLVIFRNVWGVIIPVVVIGIGVIWSIALSLYAGKPLDVMSVMQPTILSVVGLAGMVHFFNHYLKHLREGFEKSEAIKKSFSELFIAVLLTCMTTAIGFISLYLTSVPSLRFFGLYTGIGVLLMFLSIILITPGLLHLVPAFERDKSGRFTVVWQKWMRKFFIFVLNNKKRIVIGFVVVTVLSGLSLGGLKVNGYILDNLPIDHELSRSFSFFDQNFGGSKPLEIALKKGKAAKDLFQREVLLEIDKLEKFVQETFFSSAIISPLTIVKEMNQAQNSGNEKAYRVPSQGQFPRMRPSLNMIMDKMPLKVISDDLQSGRLSTRTEDMGSLQGKDLKMKLEDFVENHMQQDLLEVRITGTSHLIDISHESVTQQMVKGLGLAFAIVAIIAGFLFRSWRISFFVLLPNIIPLLWMCGVMWVLGIELKLTTAILFTVAFGIAVDDSIHFMSKFRLELGKGKSWLYALKRTFLETGKAIILSTVILVSGFSILMLSEFGVTYYSGLLISLALIFALMADLMLLPILLLFLGNIWKKKKANQ